MDNNNDLYSEAARHINACFVFDENAKLTTIKLPSTLSAFFKWYRVCNKDKFIGEFKGCSQQQVTEIAKMLKGIENYIVDQYPQQFTNISVPKVLEEIIVSSLARIVYA